MTEQSDSCVCDSSPHPCCPTVITAVRKDPHQHCVITLADHYHRLDGHIFSALASIRRLASITGCGTGQEGGHRHFWLCTEEALIPTQLVKQSDS